jgi:Flp pilus assembly protein TadB
MLIGTWLALVVLSGVAAGSIWILAQSSQRSAADVLWDLSTNSDRSTVWDSTPEAGEVAESRIHFLKDEYGVCGRFTRPQRIALDRERVAFASAAIITPLLVVLISGTSQLSHVAAALVIGVSAAYLMDKQRVRRAQSRFIRELEYFLPIVMERVVMAVQAGLDVIPAISALLELDEDEGAAKAEQKGRTSGLRGTDPVSKLLSVVVALTEAGMTFEDSLREVADAVACPSLKHAFIHLAVAQQEGGELVVPLRELSDSTQLYYQETVEEEIAGMPVKATLPLLCTFAGLILFFITSPLIQVLGLMSKAMPK